LRPSTQGVPARREKRYFMLNFVTQLRLSAAGHRHVCVMQSVALLSIDLASFLIELCLWGSAGRLNRAILLHDTAAEQMKVQYSLADSENILQSIGQPCHERAASLNVSARSSL
jgi:hypothetical protein